MPLRMNTPAPPPRRLASHRVAWRSAAGLHRAAHAWRRPARFTSRRARCATLAARNESARQSR
ncbi:hypothetical protein GBP346_A0311 [Burkholderia pseudomallei MSHR346]|nr:hypothetical protein GBP346_A0311 [Burkholderia pseudomallei MSHR346]